MTLKTIPLLLFFILPLHEGRCGSFTIPAACQQIVLGLADDWNSSNATLQRFERTGDEWRPVGQSWPARLGKNGLAWGRGLHPQDLDGPVKKEGDGRAPCGVFQIGGAFGSDEEIRKSPNLAYTRVTGQDLWIEDSSSPDYNRHMSLPGRDPANDWERKQQMRINDPAHRLKLFIAHNAWPGAVPGAGSAIFFHIWRDNGAKPTTGCTVMEEGKLRELVAWIDPTARPLYVLLPNTLYPQLAKSWALPSWPGFHAVRHAHAWRAEIVSAHLWDVTSTSLHFMAPSCPIFQTWMPTLRRACLFSTACIE